MLNTSQTLQLVLRSCSTSWGTKQVTLELLQWAKFAITRRFPWRAEASIFWNGHVPGPSCACIFLLAGVARLLQVSAC